MIKIYTQRIILAASLLTISSSVISREISYDFVQATYASASVDIDNANSLDVDGAGVSGSFSVLPSIAITADYEKGDFDKFLGVDIDTTSYILGITAHTETFAPGASLFVNLSVVGGEIDASDGVNNFYEYDTGYEASVGVRTMVTDMLEFDMKLARQDLFDDHDASFDFVVRLHASNNLSLGVGYVIFRDGDGYTVDGRFSF